MQKFLLAISIVCCLTGTAQADIFGLGDLPGSIFESSANGVSADGTFVVGESRSAARPEAFLWTQAGGMVGLGFLAGGDLESRAEGVSDDGSVIVGVSYSGHHPEAFRWTQSSGMIGLGFLPVDSASESYCVSADGLVVAGTSWNNIDRSESFRWTQAGGMVGLGDLPGGDIGGEALAMSADGSVIVGWSRANGNRFEAFRWTQAGGIVGLGDLPGGGFSSYARDVSDDGSVVVGSSSGSNGSEAFRWTQSGGMVGLGGGRAYGVSADGSVIVGRSGGGRAIIWTSTSGIVLLADLLAAQGDDLSHWTSLGNANKVSADGRTIVGWGTNVNGDQEAFMATLDTLPGLPIVIPDSFSVTRGEFVSGGLPELAGSNNMDLSIRRLASDTQSRTEFVVEAISPIPFPSSLEVTLEGSVFARTTVNQTIELYDYSTDSWEQVDTRLATRFSDSTVTVAATGDLSRFVESGIGSMFHIQARIRYQSTNPRQRFASNTDQFIWTIGL